MVDACENLPVKGVYRHYKGNFYELLYIATDSETPEKKVVYKALYGDGEIWVRPLSMWSEKITLPGGETVERFTYAGELTQKSGEIKRMIKEFEFNGHNATVIIPDNFNGKWIWKTEFFYAFDKAEQTLLSMGYARVYYGISDMYGSDRAVRLMHAFHLYVTENLGFKEKPVLFGFSRGGLYAFNYALFYPEYVGKIYLDAPVLNLKSWPPKGSPEHTQMLEEYGMTEESFECFRFSPTDNLEEFSRNDIPVLIVAGESDSVVPYKDNCLKMVNFYKAKGLEADFILKPGCEHHPHSLDDVSPIVDFVEK